MLELQVDIFISKGYTVDLNGVRMTAEKTVSEKGINGKADLSVSFVDEEEMKKLHQQYMETFEVTDVLSFPLEEKERSIDGVYHLGDIVICYKQAEKQAGENSRNVQQEIEFLVDHGCRHLLGEHHE